jgi:hypothetical protein
MSCWVWAAPLIARLTKLLQPRAGMCNQPLLFGQRLLHLSRVYALVQPVGGTTGPSRGRSRTGRRVKRGAARACAAYPLAGAGRECALSTWPQESSMWAIEVRTGGLQLRGFTITGIRASTRRQRSLSPGDVARSGVQPGARSPSTTALHAAAARQQPACRARTLSCACIAHTCEGMLTNTSSTACSWLQTPACCASGRLIIIVDRRHAELVKWTGSVPATRREGIRCTAASGEGWRRPSRLPHAPLNQHAEYRLIVRRCTHMTDVWTLMRYIVQPLTVRLAA